VYLKILRSLAAFFGVIGRKRALPKGFRQSISA